MPNSGQTINDGDVAEFVAPKLVELYSLHKKNRLQIAITVHNQDFNYINQLINQYQLPLL